MSMHIKPLTPIEEAGLRAHGLPVGTPSQPKPRGDGVNHEAIKTLNDARREAQP